MTNHNTTAPLESLIVEPKQPAAYAIIWLHGLGADGYDFQSVATELTFSQQPYCRFIFPHAPVQPVTINGGVMMRAWYDIPELRLTAHEDTQGILSSSQLITNLIEQQHHHGIAYENIILGGFSQGGAITLAAVLSLPFKIAGFIALSSYLPIGQYFTTHKVNHNQTTPIFMAHGSADPVVLPAWGQQSFQQLIDWQYPVTFNSYPIPHTVYQPEIADISNFINQTFDPPGKLRSFP